MSPQHSSSKSLLNRYERLKVLYRISDLINSTTSSQVLLRRILREAVKVMKATSGTIALVEPDGEILQIRVSYGVDPRLARQLRLRVGQGLTGFVAASGKATRVGDVLHSEHYVQLRQDVRSELAVPLKVEGRVIGVLNVDSTEMDAFSHEDEKLLKAVGVQAARIIHTSRLYERISEQTNRLETLFSVGQALIGPDPLPEVLRRITQAVLELMDIKLCSVMLLNNKRELVLSAVSGGSEHYAQRPNLPIGNSLVGEVVVQRQPLQVFDVRKAAKYKSGAMARKERLASLLSVPIAFQEHLIGILNIYTSRPRHFDDDEMTLLNAFASLCGIAIENSQRYERTLQAEQSIRQTDRLATLGILSAEIAHEVRNPVTIISMLVHSLKEDHAIAADRERDLDIIADKLERINRIVSQVLNLSKKRDSRPEWVNLNASLEDLLFLVNHNLAARNITLKKQLDNTLPAVMGDRGHFDQVFLNLLLNAIEAMPEGGTLLVRTFKATDPAGGLFVSAMIRDTGVGIQPEVLQQLFSPFVSTRKEGVGLGLFVSQKLLDQCGGKIDVKSVPDKGTTFTVSLPVEKGTA